MRVSNVHHETAFHVLYWLQEIEPDTWNKITARLAGTNTAKHLTTDGFKVPDELPFMFETWIDYACHLIENLIDNPKSREIFYRALKKNHDIFGESEYFSTRGTKTIINSVLANDTDLVIYGHFLRRPNAYAYRNRKKGKVFTGIVYGKSNLRD